MEPETQRGAAIYLVLYIASQAIQATCACHEAAASGGIACHCYGSSLLNANFAFIRAVELDLFLQSRRQQADPILRVNRHVDSPPQIPPPWVVDSHAT